MADLTDDMKRAAMQWAERTAAELRAAWGSVDDQRQAERLAAALAGVDKAVDEVERFLDAENGLAMAVLATRTKEFAVDVFRGIYDDGFLAKLDAARRDAGMGDDGFFAGLGAAIDATAASPQTRRAEALVFTACRLLRGAHYLDPEVIERSSEEVGETLVQIGVVAPAVTSPEVRA